jgi:hypothetical protein
MRNVKWLMAAGLVAATAACTQTGYDNSYAYNSGYNNRGYNNAYYGNNSGYYNAYNSGYSYNNNANPFYSQSAAAAQRRPYGDQDRDGVRNRNDMDANGDGIPDFIQR